MECESEKRCGELEKKLRRVTEERERREAVLRNDIANQSEVINNMLDKVEEWEREWRKKFMKMEAKIESLRLQIEMGRKKGKEVQKETEIKTEEKMVGKSNLSLEERWKMGSIEEKKRQSLFVAKGENWKGEEFATWIKERIGEGKYGILRISEDQNKRWIWFDRKEDKEKAWKGRNKDFEEGIFVWEEYLSLREREKRYRILEAAKITRRKLEWKENRKIRIEIEEENIIIGEFKYKWIEEEGRIEKIKEVDEKGKEQEKKRDSIKKVKEE